MSAQIPESVQNYVDAVNSSDLEGIVDAFLADGLIVDVGRHIEVHDAIRRWADAEVVGGTLDVLETHPTDHGVDLLVRFTPPGSDSGFRAWYRYAAEQGGIRRVDLTYA